MEMEEADSCRKRKLRRVRFPGSYGGRNFCARRFERDKLFFALRTWKWFREEANKEERKEKEDKARGKNLARIQARAGMYQGAVFLTLIKI